MMCYFFLLYVNKYTKIQIIIIVLYTCWIPNIFFRKLVFTYLREAGNKEKKKTIWTHSKTFPQDIGFEIINFDLDIFIGNRNGEKMSEGLFLSSWDYQKFHTCTSWVDSFFISTHNHWTEGKKSREKFCFLFHLLKIKSINLFGIVVIFI